MKIKYFFLLISLQSISSIALVHNINYDFEIKIDGIENQQNVGLCWAYSSNGIISNWTSHKEEVKSSTHVDFDENFFWYYHIREQIQENIFSFEPITISEGGNFFNVMSYIEKFGAIPEGIWKPKIKLHKDREKLKIFNEKLYFINLETRNKFLTKLGIKDAKHFEECNQVAIDLQTIISETSPNEYEKIIEIRSTTRDYLNQCKTTLTAEEKEKIENSVIEYYSEFNPQKKLPKIPKILESIANIEIDKTKIDNLLAEYFGEIPKDFKYKGKMYTPKTFADEHLKNIVQKNAVVYELIMPLTEIDEKIKIKIEKIIIEYLKTDREILLTYFHLKSMQDYFARGVLSSKNITHTLYPDFNRNNLFDMMGILSGKSHLVRITGYDEDEMSLDNPLIKLKIANSWGKKAGDKGYLHMYMDYFWNFSRSLNLYLDLDNVDDKKLYDQLEMLWVNERYQKRPVNFD